MAQVKWQGGGAPDGGAWDQANNWVGAAIPVDGDSVVFLAADWVADPTSGPTVPVTLISIADDAGFEAKGGANAVICYANITVTTVTILSACYISGGTIATATLTSNGSRITGGTVGVATLSGDNTCRVIAPATVGTTYLEGSSRFHGIGTVVYENGDQCYIQSCTATTVELRGTDPRIGSAAVIGTLNVYSLDPQISAGGIAAGNISNGPYIMNREVVLTDYDTGDVMADATYAVRFDEGEF